MKRVLPALVLVFCLIAAAARAQTPIPPLQGPVNLAQLSRILNFLIDEINSAFSSVASLTLSNVTLPAGLASLGLPVYNVIAYGAKCDSTGGTGTDDTLAINAAAAALRAHGFGILYGPPDRYCYHTGTINLANLNSQATGTQFHRTEIAVHLVCGVGPGSGPTHTCVDAIASRELVLSDFQLLTKHRGDCRAGDDAAIGLQIGRPTPAQTSDQITTIAPHIDGCFSQAALINYASEDDPTYGGIIRNWSLSAGSHVVRVDCDNHFGILASAFVTINWPSGTFASCTDITFHGTTAQRPGLHLVVTNASSNTLTFASVPATFLSGYIIGDFSVPASLTNGARIVSTTGTTIVVNQSVSSVSVGDIIVVSSPDPAVWLDGTANFAWDGGGYISVASQYPVVFYEEAGQPDVFPAFNVHIESYPQIVSNFLVSGTVTNPIIYGLEWKDEFVEASFSGVIPDFANGVQQIELDGIKWKIYVSSANSLTFHDFGLYQGVVSAVVATSGSGCAPDGATTFTLVGGNGYPLATVNGTVTGGVLGGALTVPEAGAYQLTPGTTPPTVGGSCSVQPTITPTYGNNVTQAPIWASGLELSGPNTLQSTPQRDHGLLRINGAGAAAVITLQGNNVRIPELPTATAGLPSLCMNGSFLNLCAGPVLVSALPTCNSGTEGRRAAITDDNTAIAWGATISGSGTGHVGVYCNGTAWHVYAE